MSLLLKHDQADINRRKYMVPPTIEQINDYLKLLKIKAPHFEKYFGIPHNTIGKIRYGERELPAKYWHIIYERKKPRKGLGYIPKKATKKLPKKLPDTGAPAPQSTILSRLREIDE